MKRKVVAGGVLAATFLLTSALTATVDYSASERSLGNYRLVPYSPRNLGRSIPIAYSVVDRRGHRIAELKDLPYMEEAAQLRQGHLLFWISAPPSEGSALMRTDLRTGRSTLVYKGIGSVLPAMLISTSGRHIMIARGLDLISVDLSTSTPHVVTLTPASLGFAGATFSLDEHDPQKATMYNLLAWSSDERDFWLYVPRGKGAAFVRLRDGTAQRMGELDEGFFALARDVQSQRQIFNANSGLVFHYSDRPGTNLWSYEYLWLTDLTTNQSVLLGKRAKTTRNPPLWLDYGACGYTTDEGDKFVMLASQLFQ